MTAPTYTNRLNGRTLDANGLEVQCASVRDAPRRWPVLAQRVVSVPPWLYDLLMRPDTEHQTDLARWQDDGGAP